MRLEILPLASANSSAGTVIQIVLVGLLALTALGNYRGRKSSQATEVLGSLLSTDPKKILVLEHSFAAVWRANAVAGMPNGSPV